MKSKDNSNLKSDFEREFNNARKLYEAELAQRPLAGVTVFTDLSGKEVGSIPVWNN